MKIAILGAGKMGPVLAEGLLKAGHEVIVYNQIVAETKLLIRMGASSVLSPTEAIYKADAAIVVFPDGSQSKKLLLENTDNRAFDGKAILNGSAMDPEEILEMALIIGESGGRLSALSIMSGPGELKNDMSDLVLSSNNEDQKFWTELILQIMDNVDIG